MNLRLAGLVALSAVLMLACNGPQLSASSSPSAGSSASSNPSALNANTGSYQPVVDAVANSIVLIESSGGLGSGVVFDSNGDIVTNAHVLGSATTFRVTTAEGKMYSATLVGAYVPSDVAVIRTSGASLRPAQWDNSNSLQVGQVVLAMGNPLGLQSSVTQGIVSAVGRTVTEPGGSVIPNMIQTSAAINPGNSGGGLVSLDSHVIGMPTLGAIDPQLGSAVPGIGFALSSNTVTDFAQQIIKNGKVVNTPPRISRRPAGRRQHQRRCGRSRPRRGRPGCHGRSTARGPDPVHQRQADTEHTGDGQRAGAAVTRQLGDAEDLAQRSGSRGPGHAGRASRVMTT
jgi:putative serine protease PepD